MGKFSISSLSSAGSVFSFSNPTANASRDTFAFPISTTLDQQIAHDIDRLVARDFALDSFVLTNAPPSSCYSSDDHHPHSNHTHTHQHHHRHQKHHRRSKPPPPPPAVEDIEKSAADADADGCCCCQHHHQQNLNRISRLSTAASVDFRRNGVRLHPQPTSDPFDPLNWTRMRKHMILLIVMWMYFMFTYITTTTVPSFAAIQALYGISYAQVNLTVAIPSLGLAFGPLLWSSLSDIYGRRLVFVLGTLIAFIGTIGTATSPNYAVYMVSRFFQGFGVSPGGVVGMAIINDIFFDYERGQKLGMWVLALNMGLLVGPVIGGFITLVSQFWVDWLTAILFGILLLLELAFLPETLYPRKHMLATMGLPGAINNRADSLTTINSSSVDSDMKRTSDLHFFNVEPIPGMRHPRVWDASVRFFKTFAYPHVSLVVVFYCFAWYWWSLSIITFIPAAYAQYSPSVQGLLFLGLLFGSLFAELFCSGRLSDAIVRRLGDLNMGEKEAEMRLWLVYPAALLSSTGLVLWGISIDNHMHWLVGQFAFFIFAMGIQMGNTLISTYIIDCHPLQSMSMITFYSVLLDLSACINPFFIAAWVGASGYTITFTIQGMITFGVAVPVVAFVHHYGARMRAWKGNPGWVNPEYDVY